MNQPTSTDQTPMDDDEALYAITRALTEDDARRIIDRFVAINPHWNGANADDIVQAIYDHDHDGCLSLTEPFYEAHRGELPAAPGLGYAVLAVVAMGKELTVPAVLHLMVRAGLIPIAFTETAAWTEHAERGFLLPAAAEATFTSCTAERGPADVWYHGTSDGHTVAVEDQDGTALGLLPHIEHTAHSCHSPAGYSWGYPGSGPAELARMLLIDALGDAAQCPVCGGCQQIIWPLDDAAAPVPFDTSIRDLCDPDSVMRCDACDDGYRRLPYQDFKDQYVAGWSDGWRMSRSGVRAWLTRRGEIAAEQAGC